MMALTPTQRSVIANTLRSLGRDKIERRDTLNRHRAYATVRRIESDTPSPFDPDWRPCRVLRERAQR